MIRPLNLSGLCAIGLLAGCGAEATFTVSGDAIPFNVSPEARIEGAEIWILERPDRRMTTAANGHFEFEGLREGDEVSLVLEHPDYHAIQTGTLTLGSEDVERITFQAVTPYEFDGLAVMLGILPDELNACQMVTTITRVGKSLYDPGAHGEAGATVSLAPGLEPEHGPVYFNSLVLPDRGLTESSDDGGVLFVNAPPGDYTWTATKPGVEFRPVRMKCRAGFLVNASPPWGMQAL